MSIKVLAAAWLALPLEASASPCAWIVAPEGSVRADAVHSVLQARPGLRLTLAVSPGQVDRPEALARWAAQKRLELALRVPGDPLLPLVAASRPEDAVFRIALAVEAHKKAFGSPPEGFVPGGGALSSEQADILSARGVRWAAVGDYPCAAGPKAWARTGTLALVPTRPARPREPAWDGTGPLAILPSLDAPAECSSTAGELASEASGPDAPGPEGWPTWEGPLSAWTTAPEDRQAWESFSGAAEALRKFQDSGRASLSSLDKAAAALYEAEDSRFFRSGTAEDRREFSRRLLKVYHLAGTPPPAALRSAAEGAPSGAPSACEQPEGAVLALGGRDPDGLWFSSATAPQSSSPSISELRIKGDGDDIVFILALRAPAGLENAGVDLYIDINHRAGSGSSDLLPGRGAYLPSADAWEYALTAAGTSAWLYRFSPGQGPVLIEKASLRADSARGTLTLRVKRSLLRGSPEKWGYLPLAFETNRASSAKRPPEPSSRQDERLVRIGALRLQNATR
jgi:hypothetical protein